MKPRLTGSYEFKSAFQSFLAPAKEFLIKHRIAPNTITLTSFVCMLILVIGMTNIKTRQAFLLVTPVFMLFKIACNALDGLVARETNQRTTLGAWLNESSDLATDVLVIAALFYLSLANNHVWLILLTLIMLIEFTGLAGQFKHNSRRHFGPYSKSDRAIYVSIVALALWLPANTNVINSLVVIGIVLALISWLQQVRYWLAK